LLVAVLLPQVRIIGLHALRQDYGPHIYFYLFWLLR
jgi:hypothetical protein